MWKFNFCIDVVEPILSQIFEIQKKSSYRGLLVLSTIEYYQGHLFCLQETKTAYFNTCSPDIKKVTGWPACW